MREHGQEQERRWPTCRAYSAEVGAATKAGSSGAGTAAFFNTSPIWPKTVCSNEAMMCQIKQGPSFRHTPSLSTCV
jgi:hypothetical protein